MMSMGNIEIPSAIALNGLHSGVPTRTTPTLTPTTLRKFEQTLIDLEREVEPHQNEARFVPPPLEPSMSQNGNIFLSFIDSKSWQGSTVNTLPLTPLPTADKSPPLQDQQNQNQNSSRKSMGGRRPIKDKSISPEEEERRQVRRERNKLAAARCRKRRMDQTNQLLEETEGLEEKKQLLQNEITALQREKEELESLLDSHEPACLLRNGNVNTNDALSDPMDVKPILFIKPDPDSDLELPLKSKLDPIISNPILSQPPIKPFSNQRARPNSLPVSGGFTPNHRPSEIMNIPVTAATVMPLNFESLMEGGTGLTPVSGPLVPSCSSQQRNAGCVDLSSPDSSSSKLVSL